MTAVTQFHPSHIGALAPRWDVRDRLREISPEYLAALAAEPSITIWCDGAPVVCGGVVGHCEAWGVFDERRSKRHAHSVTRAVKRYLATFPYLYANCDRPVDARLLLWLGFDERGLAWRNNQQLIHFERAA